MRPESLPSTRGCQWRRSKSFMPGLSGNPRFAIRPYPSEWERHIKLRDGTAVFVRPVRPEDEPLYGPFFAAVTPGDLRLRFFAPIKEFSHTFIARFTQIDYARAMAFIALDEATGAMLGVVRLHATADYDSGEYAILVRSDMKGHGLGWLLMQLIIEYARSEGIHSHQRASPARERNDAGHVPGPRLSRGVRFRGAVVGDRDAAAVSLTGRRLPEGCGRLRRRGRHTSRS